MKPIYKIKNGTFRTNGDLPTLTLMQPYRRSIFQRLLCYIKVRTWLYKEPSTTIPFRSTTKSQSFIIKSNTVWIINQTPTQGNANRYKFSIITGKRTSKVTIYRVQTATPSANTTYTISYGNKGNTDTLRISYNP